MTSIGESMVHMASERHEAAVTDRSIPGTILQSWAERRAEVSVGLCPIDLAMCERTDCRRDRCELAAAAPLLVCWDCGAVEAEASAAGTCVSCLRICVPDLATEVI